MGYTPETIRNWIKGGRFPAHDYECGNVRLWSRDAVEEAAKRLPRKIQPIIGNTPEEGIRHVAS